MPIVNVQQERYFQRSEGIGCNKTCAMINKWRNLLSKRQRVISEVPTTPMDPEKSTTVISQQNTVISRFLILDYLVGITRNNVANQLYYPTRKVYLSSTDSRNEHRGIGLVPLLGEEQGKATQPHPLCLSRILRPFQAVPAKFLV